jgi:toxin CptA
MYSAPSVTYPVGASLVARRWLLAVWTAGLGCTAGVAIGSPGMAGWRMLVLVAGASLAGLAALATLRRLGVGELDFQDQAWSLSGGSPVADAQVRIALDLQHAMLLLLVGPAQRRCWIWVERNDRVASWLDLRRAVHAATPSDAAKVRPGVEFQGGGRTGRTP